MGLPSIFKFAKLEIQALDDELNPQGEPMQVMFNPSSFSMNYANRTNRRATLNPEGQAVTEIEHISSKFEELQIKLIFDGTGVSDFGITTGFGLVAADVSAMVKDFLKLCLRVEGSIHQPQTVSIKWGKAISNFVARLQSVDISYTMFDRDGMPLRAELDCQFAGRENEDGVASSLISLSSPDLTHIRVVQAGDTLPALAREVYGSAHYYLKLAEANGLDNFRELQPGQELIFPPIA